MQSSTVAFRMGWRAGSSIVAYHTLFTDPPHPVVQGKLRMLEPQMARESLPVGKDVVLSADLRDKTMKMPERFVDNARLRGVLQDLLKEGADDMRDALCLLQRIPFRKIAKVAAAAWDEFITLDARKSEDLPTLEDIVVERGTRIVIPDDVARRSPRVVEETQTPVGLDRDDERTMRSTRFRIAGLPDAVVTFPPRTKPRVTIPGVPLSHPMAAWEESSAFVRDALFFEIASELQHPMSI